MGPTRNDVFQWGPLSISRAEIHSRLSKIRNLKCLDDVI